MRLALRSSRLHLRWSFASFAPFVLPAACLLWLGCSGDNGDASGGTGGSPGTGGQPWAGGSPTDSGGAAPGAGSGGTTASGGGGGAGGAGGASGDGGALPDAPTSPLDDCFMGLRALVGRTQLATKRSANGAYEVRLALEVPPDAVGTSGTVPWAAIRVGIAIPNKQVCLKDEATLKAAYNISHHNCSDRLTVTDNGLTYALELPDTDPTRPETTLTITGEAAVPAVKLATATCTTSNGVACKSGGPCQ